MFFFFSPVLASWNLTDGPKKHMINLAAHPWGHCMKRILIVPGAHGSLDNISASGEWVEDDVFTYMGQTRKHQKGAKAGRILGAWRKLRESDPHLFRHFSVYSQPASNMDGISMSWVIKAMSKEHPVALHQRDCFSAAFSSEVMNMQYLAHEASCSVMAKMTAAMQLTDTDFSHQFKSLIRGQVDECNRKGMEAIRSDPAAPSEIYKMSLKDVASCIDHAMQTMIDKNHEDNWVLAGMRRNGFLAVRPDENGHLKWCGDQSWCASMPLGSSRIPASWLWKQISPHSAGWSTCSWAHLGSHEWSDRSSRSHRMVLSSAISCKRRHGHQHWGSRWGGLGPVRPISAATRVAAGSWPLEKALWMRLAEISETRWERRGGREKSGWRQRSRSHMRRERRSTRICRANRGMSPWCPLCRQPRHWNHQCWRRISWRIRKKHAGLTDQKKGKKQLLKNQQRKAAAKALKDKKAADANADAHEKMPPLPPPPDAPPDAPAISPELPKGTFRIVSDEASDQLYGRQGSVLSIGNAKYQLLLQKKKAQHKEQLAWAPLAQVHEINENLPVWAWQQFSLSRYLKSEILKDSGTISHDVATIEES